MTAEPADPLLTTLILLAENGTNLPISVTIHGVLVSGVVIEEAEYLRAIANRFEALLPDEERRLVNRLRLRTGQAEKLRVHQWDDRDLPVRTHLHLRSIHIVVDGQAPIVSPQDQFWRGRIADISSFVVDFIRPRTHAMADADDEADRLLVKR